MKIAIYGLGYVGLTAAGCLTKEGHTVLGVDISEAKVNSINKGQTPIFEPGLEELIASAVKHSMLTAYQDIGEKLAECDMAIVCVGTPSAPDGSHDMTYIAEVSRQIARGVGKNRTTPLTVVYRSTIRPGTLEELVLPILRSILGDEVERIIELVYNPEFLRESLAIKDYFSPPKIVVGTADGKPSKNMDLVNENIKAPVFYTHFREAEFTKFVDNTFHALKVSFANEIGRISLKLNISAAKIHEIFVSDRKLNISPYYLRPGGAFGGSCLPKDVRALQYISSDIGTSTHVIDSLIRTNEAHKHFLFSYVTDGLEDGATILMVGLAFKADTDDLRESPNLDLARKLLQSGYRLAIYDKSLVPSKLIGKNLGYSFTHLPNMELLLISKEEAESQDFRRVIDTAGYASSLNLKCDDIMPIHSLP